MRTSSLRAYPKSQASDHPGHNRIVSEEHGTGRAPFEVWDGRMVWLVGIAVTVEILHPGWRPPISLLIFVAMIELAWRAGMKATGRPAPKARGVRGRRGSGSRPRLDHFG